MNAVFYCRKRCNFEFKLHAILYAVFLFKKMQFWRRDIFSLAAIFDDINMQIISQSCIHTENPKKMFHSDL